jgi:hypothetical protein
VLLAALGIAVLAIAVVALRHPGNRAANAGVITHRTTTPAKGTASATPTPRSTPTSTPTSPTATPTQGVAKLPLVVLNNTTVQRLAQQVRSTFEAGGWTVTSTGNLQNDIVSTCAYYDPSVAGAQAAATALQRQFPAIKRVQPKFAELPAGPIVVVLTPDYTSG